MRATCASTRCPCPAASASAAASVFSAGASSPWPFQHRRGHHQEHQRRRHHRRLSLHAPAGHLPRPSSACRRCRCSVGVGGGLTNGVPLRPAWPPTSEHQGAYGVVLQQPASATETIHARSRRRWRSPWCITVVSEQTDIGSPTWTAGVDFHQRVRRGQARRRSWRRPCGSDYPGGCPSSPPAAPRRRRILRHHPAPGPMPSLTHRPPAASLFAKTMAGNRSELE